MVLTYFKGLKRHHLCLFFLIIILIQFHFFIVYGFAKKEREISGFSKETELNRGESVSYRFSNNIQFEIGTEVFTELEINYNEKIENRETSMNINNDNPISLEIDVERSMENFGSSKNPKEPKQGGNQLRSQYQCIYRIRSNSSIEKIKLEFKKDAVYGLDPLIEYSLAVYEEDDDSWELLDTEEISHDSEIYLKSSISDLEADKNYFITIYEVSYINYIWIFGAIILAVGILSLAVIISKKDYIHYLRTRSTSIQKGAHRLTLDEVLENENRNQIIDLILNEPGIHFNELLRKSELAPGNLVWHLDILETYKIIGKKRIGNFIAYFPYYQKNPISNLDLKLSKSKLTLDILEMIESEPGIWSNLITKRKKVDHKTIHYHIKKLMDLGLIIFKKEGRKKRIYPNLDSDYFKNSLTTD
jgi:predicted transcriptional regulator